MCCSALRWQDLDWTSGEFGTLHFRSFQYQGSVKRGSNTGRQISLLLTGNLADALRLHEARFRGTEDHAGFRTTDLAIPARAIIDHYNHVSDDGRRAILEAVDGSGSE
jgi:hypothetical protein